MNYEKMTIKLQEALQESNSIARQRDHSEIGNEHILKALLEQKDGLVPPLVECVGIPSEKLISQIDSLLSQYPVVRGNTQMALSPSAQKVLAKAENEMSSLKDQFLSVEELEDLCGGPYEEAAVEETVAEVPAAEKESDDNFITADDMLDKISRILNDDNMAKNYAAELELFKKLRVLSSFLPEKDKNSFECCRMRMVIEYIIQKMSGKRGLLITAESLIKSGVLGEEYNRQLEDCCEEELSNDLIRHVISDMKKLAQGLEDKYLCTAPCVSADSILEQIALRNQKSEIF